MVAAGGAESSGSIAVSGKWIALSRSGCSSARSRPGSSVARAIAVARPMVEPDARYERTTVDGNPPPASGAIDGR